MLTSNNRTCSAALSMNSDTGQSSHRGARSSSDLKIYRRIARTPSSFQLYKVLRTPYINQTIQTTLLLQSPL